MAASSAARSALIFRPAALSLVSRAIGTGKGTSNSPFCGAVFTSATALISAGLDCETKSDWIAQVTLRIVSSFTPREAVLRAMCKSA